MSFVSEIRGNTTTVIFRLSINAGNWNNKLLPQPVGSTTKRSSLRSNTFTMACACSKQLNCASGDPKKVHNLERSHEGQVTSYSSSKLGKKPLMVVVTTAATSSRVRGAEEAEEAAEAAEAAAEEEAAEEETAAEEEPTGNGGETKAS
jgi:hypothetical protein